MQQVGQLAEQYQVCLKALPPEKLAAKKDEVKHVRDVFKFLVRFHVIPDTFSLKAEIEQLISNQGWDKKK